MENEEIEDYVRALEKQNQELSNKNLELNGNVSASYFGGQEDKTLIHYQLEAEELLERINRQLSGEIPKMDREGNIYYEKTTEEELVTLNDKGRTGIMYILGLYINKNTFLTTLDITRVYEILFRLGTHLNEFFYCNLTEIGFNTPQKKSKANLIQNSILDAVEFALRRSLGGEERRTVTEKRIITDNQSYNSPSFSSGSNTKGQKFNIFNPKSW